MKVVCIYLYGNEAMDGTAPYHGSKNYGIYGKYSDTESLMEIKLYWIERVASHLVKL
jgi:hypothetical protein